MDKKLKTRWVKALLSGRYKQTQLVLQDKKGANCCLGVLCRIARLKQTGNLSHRFFQWKKDGDGEQTMLPDDFRNYVGISAIEQTTLVDMNDDLGLSFKEVAKWIKKNL